MSEEQMTQPDRVRQPLGDEQIKRVLETQRIARFCFCADGEMHLIPMGFMWYDNAVCGITSTGRKVNMAKVNPKVVFQIDTSSRTGNYLWHSVTGEGMFEIIPLPQSLFLVRRYVKQVSDAPAEMKLAFAKEAAAGNLIAWRIRPTRLAGRWLGSDTIDNELLMAHKRG